MASPELKTLIDQLRAQALLDLPLEELRKTFEQMAFPVDADVRTESVDAGGVPCEWVAAPNADSGRTIFYLHGGGYVIGSVHSHRALVANLSRAAGARGLTVGYRLAPEHPFPAAVDDATTAYRWLLSTGVDPKRVVVAGDSAGGGLTVALLVNLRYRGIPLPAAGVCMSPWVDLEGLGESMTSRADRDPLVQRPGLQRMAAAYLAGADPKTPLAAPLYADLSGLPPLLIQVGGAETLYDDSTRLAEKARRAGVDVTFDAWEEMIHVWQLFAPVLPEGREAIAKIGQYIRSRTS
jgi:acetyl esterase/lipase